MAQTLTFLTLTFTSCAPFILHLDIQKILAKLYTLDRLDCSIWFQFSELIHFHCLKSPLKRSLINDHFLNKQPFTALFHKF